MSKRLTQTEWVLRRLRKGRTLTAKRAMDERGIMRLGARIWELRQNGYKINTHMKRVKNRFGQVCYIAAYWLRGSPIFV